MASRVYITHAELKGRRATDEELSRLLQGITLRSCFLELGMINALLSLSDREKEYADIHRMIMEYLLPAETLELVETKFPNESADTRPVFFRHQLLTLMKRVLAESPDEGVEASGPLTEQLRHQLGEAAIVISDLLVAADQEEKLKASLAHDDALDELLVQWLPTTELVNPPEELFALVRHNSYLSKLSPSLSAQTTSTGEDLSSYFRRTNGIDPGTYAYLLHCISAYYRTQEIRDIARNTAKLRIDMGTVFSKMRLSRREIDAFFELTARSIDNLRELFRGRDAKLRPQYDFTPLREFPLVHISPTVVACVDYPFLIEKIAPGLYHTIVNRLPRVDQDAFRAVWGYVFHNYVSDLFKGVYPPSSGRFLDRAHFQTRSAYEGFDGVLDYVDSLVLMEYKGGYLTLPAKYSGAIDTFMADFNTKFGCDRGAAIEQLVRKVELMFNQDRNARRGIQDLDIRAVRSAFPVVIVQDLALRSPLVNWKARQLFQQELAKRAIDDQIAVRQLSLITIEELEFLLPYLEAGDLTMIEVLQRYTAEYRPGQHEPHENFGSALSQCVSEKGIARKPNAHVLAEYDEILNSLRALFDETDI